MTTTIDEREIAERLNENIGGVDDAHIRLMIWLELAAFAKKPGKERTMYIRDIDSYMETFCPCDCLIFERRCDEHSEKIEELIQKANMEEML